MSLLYLDLVGGIAGDMTVAALVHLGVPLETLRAGLATLALPGVEISIEPARRHAVAGLRFLVRLDGKTDVEHLAGGPAKEHSHEHGHSHGHEHAPDHGHSGDQAQSGGHGGSGGGAHGDQHTHRPWREIRTLLQEAALPEGAKTRALAVFSCLAEAEGAVHGSAAEDVEFHEVGGWDAIADIVCACLALDHLGIDRIYCSPVPLGAGQVRTAHGMMPVPAPATLKLLQGFAVVQGGPPYERTTPTGAALLAALAQPAPEPFAYVPRGIGVGIGTRDHPEVANLLRAVLAEPLGDAVARAAGRAGGGGSVGSSSVGSSSVAPSAAALPWPDVGIEQVECALANVDDGNPEWLGHLSERLLAAGALDVALAPIQMKKGRPGTQVQVLYAPELRADVLELLFREGTTLGVRYHTLERAVLPREEVRVQTLWGSVAGKVSGFAGKVRFAPEYEDCRRIAQQYDVPLPDVYRVAQRAWEDSDTALEDIKGK